MNSKSSSCRAQRPRGTDLGAKQLHPAAFLALVALLIGLGHAPWAAAGDKHAPDWMHALVNAPLPAHDEKTEAVLLYSEDVLTVQPDGKLKGTLRRAYKILRPEGRHYGFAHQNYDSETRITNMRGWCIPAQGKDYEVTEKDAIDQTPWGEAGGVLVEDIHRKTLWIPAPDPGSIVGFEIEHEDRPYVLQDEWEFQRMVPVREARYTLQLAPGWEYKAFWINHPEVAPTAMGSSQWQWRVNDVAAIKPEEDMPPMAAIAGRMIVSLFPPGRGAQEKGFANWNDVGAWDTKLHNGRRDASPEIKLEVAKLTAAAPTVLDKMRALAHFLQREIRYVGIELGIGGYQPHAARDSFAHRYGDCKDKATLLSSMLREIGVESYPVLINMGRNIITPDMPPQSWFNHEILAIRLPDGVTDPSLLAIRQHAKLGRLLIFDPTNDLVPFGQLPGYLQGNYGLLDVPDQSELIELPRLAASTNGIERAAHLDLKSDGTLAGDVKEVRRGDYAFWSREELRTATTQADRVKPLESLLTHSLGTFRLTKASVSNLEQIDQPFILNYSIVAANYAKSAGNLLLVRPRVVGSKSSALLETKEARTNDVILKGLFDSDEGPRRDSDTFEITLPPGFEVDDLPPPINAEYSFASYHSKTDVQGNILRYTRTFEVKELSVPLKQVDELKKLYRIIASDERNAAVLKPAGAN
jgi:Domain of Unknown Function with PDB structure (DUF3857)/Transglutaminase-like superfamily